MITQEESTNITVFFLVLLYCEFKAPWAERRPWKKKPQTTPKISHTVVVCVVVKSSNTWPDELYKALIVLIES